MERAAEVHAAAEEVEARHEEVAIRAVAGDAGVLLERVERVQVAVAYEAVERAVVLVRPRLGDGEELPAVRARELGRELVLNQGKLGDVLRRDVGLRAGDGLVSTTCRSLKLLESCGVVVSTSSAPPAETVTVSVATPICSCAGMLVI
jgi:hypothetical protein